LVIEKKERGKIEVGDETIVHKYEKQQREATEGGKENSKRTRD